ncbi:MAG: hypothetical protein M3230_05615, partial [Thermoproteota archaeon]|nr:hypothetical protein [Thermoproteota archaeon]
MLSKYNKKKAVLATLALMLLSSSMASWMVISTPNYASAQGVTEQGGSYGTNATTITSAGNATNATTTTGAGNATNATTTAGTSGGG